MATGAVASVKTFTTTTTRIVKPDGTTDLRKPKISLDEQINTWVTENRAMILHSSITGFIASEQVGEGIARHTIHTAQVVYMDVDGYYEREAAVSAEVAKRSGGNSCKCKPAESPTDLEIVIPEPVPSEDFSA